MKKQTTKKPAAKKATAPKASPNTAEATRNSQFAGRKPYPKTKANPRREGSHGFRSLGIIIAKPGIGYEQFLAAGGRNRDLRYDVAKKHVEARG